MATNSAAVEGVAGRYATALYELATENSAVSDVENDLKSVQSMINESEDLQRLVRSPVISAEDQVRGISAVLEKAGISGLPANFVKVLAKNRRLFAVSDMISAFQKLAAAERGEVTADVTSASELSDAQVGQLKDTLKQAVGKHVMLSTHVDASLLGGLIVKVGSRMVDSSLKTKLASMKVRLTSA